MNTYTAFVSQTMRLDKALALAFEEFSRTRLQSLLLKGNVQVNTDIITIPSWKVRENDKLILTIPALAPGRPIKENIALNVVFEDEYLLVINKPAGLVVHPGAGNVTGTLVNALLYYCADSLSGIGGVARPGIVHRLDKNTSGLLIVAKTDEAHRHLSCQLAARTLHRTYTALVFGTPILRKGTIDCPIGRHSQNRLKMAVCKTGRTARTHWHVDKNFGALSLCTCHLESGRTHQIRVHMSHIGHPLVGDPLYGPQPNALAATLRRHGYDPTPFLAFSRQALHARSLVFIHPITHESHTYEVPLPADLLDLLAFL